MRSLQPILKYDREDGNKGTGGGNEISGATNAANNAKNFNPYSLAGGLMYGIGSMFSTPNANLNTNNQMSASIRNGISGALMSSGNPYAMAAGAAYMAIDKTGGFTDASKGLGGGLDTANKASSILLPGAGWFTPKTQKYKMSDSLQQMSGAYMDSYNDSLTAQQNAGAKLLFGKGKANRMINRARQADYTIQGIQREAKDDFLAQNTMSNTIAMSNQNQLMNNQGLARAAKFGAKLERMRRTRDNIFFNSIPIEEDNCLPEMDTSEFFNSLSLVESFKQGGEFNVIPEGALHARKHNMEGAEHLTKKGIPVVSDGEGGKMDQQAEIEKNEIIFRLEVTKKIENWLEQYNKSESKKEKDAIAIEAGKLLTQEIMENTQDRTGLMDTIQVPTKLKNGGSLKEHISKLSPEKLKELELILNYVEST